MTATGEQRHEALPPGCPMWDKQATECRFPGPVSGRARDTKSICESFADIAVGEWRCCLATVWWLDPLHTKLSLAAVSGIEKSELDSIILDCFSSLSGRTVERKVVTEFEDVAESSDGRVFPDAELIRRKRLKRMVSVPILNSCNLNQVLCVADLFPTELSCLPPRGHLSRTAQAIAVCLETALRDRCFRHTNRLDMELSRLRNRTSSQLCRGTAGVIQRDLHCDAVAIFLVSSDGMSLDLVAASGDPCPGDYPRTVTTGPAYRCWQQNRELVSFSLTSEDGIEAELGRETPHGVLTGAYQPLRDFAGQPRGVIACINTSGGSGEKRPRPFTYEDVAVMESSARAFVPQLDILVADETRTRSLNILAHELRVPVTAFRAGLERLEGESRVNAWHFRYNHFDEMGIYIGLMRRLLLELDLIRIGPDVIPIEPVLTHFQAVIIAPAKRFLQPLLRKRGFEPSRIRYEGFDTMPKLCVDPAFMTQVVFNLLDNAIKYAYDDPRAFDIEIIAKTVGKRVEMLFRDYGIGVPAGMEERVFQAGLRGPKAHQYDVAGEGIGLWVARELVHRHGGELKLKRRAQPTEFMMWLPL